MRSPSRFAFRVPPRGPFAVLGGLAFLVLGAFASTDVQAAAPRFPPPAALVPIVVKAAEYDRHFSTRAAGLARIVVVYRDGDEASVRGARETVRLLANTTKIAGLMHDQRAEPYAGANALAGTIRARQIGMVIVSTGLGDEAQAIAHELDGIDVLSVALDPDDVPKGVVLGVDARAGKATLVIRLSQARRQNVAFEAALLKLARIE